MQCMKCGRGVEAGEVFCELCREDMEKYPVKPGTAVVIPQRPERTQPKRPTKKQLSYEEQLAKARKLNRTLAMLLAIYMVVAGGLLFWCLSMHFGNKGKFLPGQNYSVIQDDEPTDAFSTGEGTDGN